MTSRDVGRGLAARIVAGGRCGRGRGSGPEGGLCVARTALAAEASWLFEARHMTYRKWPPQARSSFEGFDGRQVARAGLGGDARFVALALLGVADAGGCGNGRGSVRPRRQIRRDTTGVGSRPVWPPGALGKGWCELAGLRRRVPRRWTGATGAASTVLGLRFGKLAVRARTRRCGGRESGPGGWHPGPCRPAPGGLRGVRCCRRRSASGESCRSDLNCRALTLTAVLQAWQAGWKKGWRSGPVRRA